jgi:hypothetical protein
MQVVATIGSAALGAGAGALLAHGDLPDVRAAEQRTGR